MATVGRAIRVFFSLVAPVLSCGGKSEPKTAASASGDPAPKWESSGESPPAPGGQAAAKPNAPAASGGEITIDLDEPISKAASTKDLSAAIGGKEIFFKRARMLGNGREGYAIQVYEAKSGEPAKAEINLRVGATPVMGKTLPVTLTFIQITDNGPMSLRGVRALECTGKGKLQISALPALPKQPPKEETQAGTTSGTLMMGVKCTGDAKEYGAFVLDGRFTAEVLLTPPE